MQSRLKYNPKNVQLLKQKFFSNPLFEKIKDKYPFRDYEYQFYLMCDWWGEVRGYLPKNISAFSQWISRTKPDEGIKFEQQRLEKERKWREFEKKVEQEKCVDATEYIKKIKKQLGQKMKM